MIVFVMLVPSLLMREQYMYNLYDTYFDEFYCFGDSQLPPNTINVGSHIELDKLSLILLCSKIVGVDDCETSSDESVNILYDSVKCDWENIMVIEDGDFTRSTPLQDYICDVREYYGVGNG